MVVVFQRFVRLFELSKVVTSESGVDDEAKWC